MQNSSPRRIAENLPASLVRTLARIPEHPNAEIELVGSPRSTRRLMREGVVKLKGGGAVNGWRVEITELGWDVIGACADLEVE